MNGNSSPQWKVQNTAITKLAQKINSSNYSQTNGIQKSMNALKIDKENSNSISVSRESHSIRERGIVEKLLHSYGFIRCCDREARLFFHFSEYGGNIDELQIGDTVEFQMSFDRRTGKPIAIELKLLCGQADQILGEERMTGNIVQVPTQKLQKNGFANCEAGGCVTYETNGESFFLHFILSDVNEKTTLKQGDRVYFYIATNTRDNSRKAVKIELLDSHSSNDLPEKKYQGVVCSKKDNFGFIEREDVVEEIFFHYTEFAGEIEDLQLGDDVEFEIKLRNAKEVATKIKQLPEGTVVFEDVGIDRRRGRIKKTLKGFRERKYSDPLGGKIIYETVEGSVEIPFGDKDQVGEYSLQISDIVEFNIATDRRDKLQRATNISLVEDTFLVNGEKRETGYIASINDGFGFIKCAERDARIFFHFNEMIDINCDIKIKNEVQFQVIQDAVAIDRTTAIRIKNLPKGYIKSEVLDKMEPINSKLNENDVQGSNKLSTKDQSEENTATESSTNSELSKRNIPISKSAKKNFQQGFIAALKENYGFIELSSHEKELFFHFSAYDGNPNDLDLGDEVEFSVARKTNKPCADNVRRLTKGTVAPEEVQSGTLRGTVLRCMRIANPEQEEYSGLIKVVNEDESEGDTYPFGITSLCEKREFLQKGDSVKFSLAKVKLTGQIRACKIVAIRKLLQARVDSIKGQYGFLSHEVEENKKLFFHMTEVLDSVQLKVGDNVEFVLVQKEHNQRFSACNVRKITIEEQRPERLISRLKSTLDEDGPRVVVLRQPRGPDGSAKFKERIPWKPYPIT